MKRIVVACPNIALDRTLRIPSLEPGGVIRSSTIAVAPGGKGANVARIAACLGVPVSLVTMLGGRNGDHFRELLSDTAPDVALRSIDTNRDSRVNLALIDDAGLVTVINDHGAPVQPEAWRAYERAVRDQIYPGDILVCSGSLPLGAPADGFARLIQATPAQDGIRAIVDTSGPALAYSLAARPSLVAPNLDEAESVTALDGSPVARMSGSRARAAAAAGELVRSGAAAALVSIGADGVVCVGDGRRMDIGAAEVSVSTAVGAGDAMVAGIAAAWVHQYDLADSLIVGTAVAGASVEHETAGIISRKRAAQLRHQLSVVQDAHRDQWFL